MKKILVISWRNLWRNKKRTYITLSSVVFAVMIATFMRGLQLGSYDKMFGDAIKSSTGHLAIMDKLYWDDKALINSMELSPDLENELNEDDQIEFWAPQIMSGGLASTGDYTRAIAVQGIDPEIMDIQMGLKDKIIKGSYLDYGDEAIMIGKDLATFLRADIGDTLVIFGQGYMGVTAAGKYPIKGIFDHPMLEFNKRIGFIPLPAAQYLFFMDGRVTNINIQLKNDNDLAASISKYSMAIDTSLLEVKDWKAMNQELVQQLESDNYGGIIMVSILYMVIGFGLFGTILMMTMERKKEFSIMMAIGMQKTKLIVNIMVESAYIASLGSIIGLVLSFPLVFYFAYNPIEITGERAEIYYSMNMEPIMPISTNPDYMISQFIVVLVLSMFASILPLYNIFKFDIVAILRGRQ
ncbi:MAG: FtsX-like permease family protein [Reichenbachiella sp.]